MTLNSTELIITFLALAAGTALTRFVPFFLFPEGKKRPAVMDYLGQVLPPAMIGLLIIYCLRNTEILTWPHCIPEVLAIALTAILQLWRKNFLISIAAGTALYMFLVQGVF